MSYPDIDEARRQHGALQRLFVRAPDVSDAQMLRKVEQLCAQAGAAVRDEYCRQEIAIVAGYAAELFAQGASARYESESMSGAEFLRLQILKALDSFHSRLYSIEAIRRAGERELYPSALRGGGRAA